jgi:hypothetical protein
VVHEVNIAAGRKAVEPGQVPGTPAQRVQYPLQPGDELAVEPAQPPRVMLRQVARREGTCRAFVCLDARLVADWQQRTEPLDFLGRYGLQEDLNRYSRLCVSSNEA